ncbi:MAG TPA: efflux RND transporter periplasmic adaptor subunit [Cycloclasticus sp.]|jgi:RND family efflux transporter MFP subunit|nr:efflux RND transporter periplasmic adaptor subunit [Cycloclasticus sp.]HIL91846.1 efflux RND transporter periplasmic adaptor subunit [Cycloclasticus sp.]
MNIIKSGLIILLFVLLNISNGYAEAEHDHENETANAEEHAEHGDGDEHGGEHEEENSVQLNAAQRKAADIAIKTLQLSQTNSEISAPGEITLNAYATSQVVSRISAQVVQRHAMLGDEVTIGQPLITLSSVDMAQAQGDLLVATREWNRVRKLGRKVVSGARYIQAKVNNEQALAKAQAYGMSQQQINALIKGGKGALANGRFQLQALQNGTVIHDEFTLGELVEPGRMLFEISDETSLWVNARLTAEQALDVRVGAIANVLFRDKVLSGKVIQRHHSLDETTRTIGVRIEIANPNDLLHPGVFVDTKIMSNNMEKALSVPADAVLRSPDGDWMVFVEHEDNEFEPQEVEVIRTNNGVTVIEGIKAGARVVTKGAFFLQSELAKSGFEIHNH